MSHYPRPKMGLCCPPTWTWSFLPTLLSLFAPVWHKSCEGLGYIFLKSVSYEVARMWLSILCTEWETRGQWPYRHAATRAMRDRHVTLYDLNYLSKFWWPLRPWRPPNGLMGHMISNFKSLTLITLHIIFNSHFGGLGGHGGLQTTFEVILPQIWNQQTWLTYCL